MSNTNDSMTNQTPAAAWANFRAEVKDNKNWFIILGILLIILGCVSIVYPLVSTLAAELVVAWIFLFAGIMQVIYAFQTKTWSGFFLDLLVGILYIIAGGWMIYNPPAGALSLTIIIGILFLMEAGIRTYMAFQMKPIKGWGWVLFSAIMSGIAGLLILMGLPDTSVWVLGLLVGINFISSGWALIFLATATDEAVESVNTMIETERKAMGLDDSAADGEAKPK